MDKLLQQMAESRWHVPYVSLYQALCQGGTCAEYADAAHSIPMLTDTDHFTEPGSVFAMKAAVTQVRLNESASKKNATVSSGMQAND
jgi:hypothetical protein